MAICKLCFKKIRETSFIHLIRRDLCLCENCYNEMKPTFKRFYLLRHKGTALYDYTSAIRSRLYQFKGCYDIEISTIFIDRYKYYFRLKYHGFLIIPAPSYSEDNEQRGFNHVIEMFKTIGLPIVEAFIKTEHHKQTESGFLGRQEIGNYIKLNGNPDLRNKKLLLVDDVFTTGSTLKSLITLLEPLHPKTIEILVMSKTTNHR